MTLMTPDQVRITNLEMALRIVRSALEMGRPLDHKLRGELVAFINRELGGARE